MGRENQELEFDTRLIAEMIVKAREEGALSQRELARKTGLSNSTISRIENGEQLGIKMQAIYKLSKATHLNLFVLIGEMYPQIREEYKDFFEIIDVFDTLPVKDRQTLIDIAKGLVLQRGLGQDDTLYCLAQEKLTNK